jgi:hypothetical protein
LFGPLPFGLMFKWLMEEECKSTGNAYTNSNPTQPNFDFTKLNGEIAYGLNYQMTNML